MKKVLLQLGQWILKYKKRLIYGALALFIGQICFFGLGGIGMQNEVFAADGDQGKTSENLASERLPVLQLFNKIIYVCIYPILIVAGKLVDNSLVYGEVFKFDAVLWQLWVIVRNIANFALGFIFVFYIFKYLIKQDEKQDWKWLIIRTLIAGVGIQASWFIMAALIDISTIMAYGIGGLPITVLGSKDDDSLRYNPYVLNTVVSVDAKDVDSYHIYLSNTTGDKFISTCGTFVYSYIGSNEVQPESIDTPWNSPIDTPWDSPSQSNDTVQTEKMHMEEELIFMPKMVYYLSEEDKCYPTQGDRCHIGDQVYKIAGYHFWDASSLSSSCDDLKNFQNDMDTIFAENVINYKNSSPQDIEGEINAGALLRIGQTGTNFGLDEWNKEIGPEWGAPRIKDILSGSYVGVFTALYGSLLNAGADLRISNTDNNGTFIKLLNAALSGGHMIAIAIPLLVMVVVLVMRIGVLRMIIVLSPVVVLLKVFEFDKKIGKESILRFIKLDNLLGVVFAPVVICFAASLSTVLVRIILAVNWINIETGKQDILGGLVQLNIAGVGINIGKLVGSVIGIAITWFLMWAAVKASELGKTGIIKSIEDLSKTALGSIPVIPVPTKNGGVDYIGMDKAFGLNGRTGIISDIGNQVESKYSTYSGETLKQRLDLDKAEKNAESARYANYSKRLFDNGINEIQGKDWRTIEITVGEGQDKKKLTFNKDLNDGQREDIINRINEMKNEKLREAYGSGVPTITIGGETWNFVGQESEKDENGRPKTNDKGEVIMENVYKYVKQKKD